MAYYHYTSRQGAQDIICAQLIVPGPSSRIYLAPLLYVVGYEAANALSIVSKPVEMVCEIPDNLVAGPTPPRKVRLLRGPDGTILRRGGGEEVSTVQPIRASRRKWISLREP